MLIVDNRGVKRHVVGKKCFRPYAADRISTSFGDASEFLCLGLYEACPLKWHGQMKPSRHLLWYAIALIAVAIRESVRLASPAGMTCLVCMVAATCTRVLHTICFAACWGGTLTVCNSCYLSCKNDKAIDGYTKLLLERSCFVISVAVIMIAIILLCVIIPKVWIWNNEITVLKWQLYFNSEGSTWFVSSCWVLCE